MTLDRAFSAALIGVVNSITSGNPTGAWGLFSLNTLRCLSERVDDPPTSLERYDFISSVHTGPFLSPNVKKGITAGSLE